MTREIRFSQAAVAAACQRRGPKYCARVASLARRDGENVFLSEVDLATLRRAFPKRARAGLLRRLADAIWRWVRAGCPMPSGRDLLDRHAACRACDLNVGWGILGGCRRCQCTGAKLLLSTETCPLGKWKNIT